MAAAFSSAGTKVNKAGTGTPDEIVVSPPATHVAGDLFVMQVMSWTNVAPPAAVTTPSGWIALGSASDAWGFGGRYTMWFYYRVATSSSESSVTVAIESSSRADGQIYRFTGVDATTPIDATVAYSGEGSGQTPALTTTTANALMVFAGQDTGDNNWTTPPAGSVENVDSATYGLGRFYIATETRATAGTEAATSWTGSGSGRIAAFSLREGAGGGGATFTPRIIVVS